MARFVTSRWSLSAVLLLLLAVTTAASAPPRLAVLELGSDETAARVGDQLLATLTAGGAFAPVSRGQAQAAARGIGSQGSLNLTLAEARDLGAAVGCDFYVAGRAETLRRSSLTRPLYYESDASLFFVSARTGRLVLWDQLSVEADAPEESETRLLEGLKARVPDRYAEALRAARESEERERLKGSEAGGAALVPEAPEEGTPEARGFRPPQPYRRLRPASTEAAARHEVEATVDVSVTLDVEGEVKDVAVVRWAGYGLDESVAAAVRRMHFRPATREGTPVPVRVLLRYNFRRPTK
ncbi:MAG: energy transducer TonB [Pyrinomonadaceae bacterium]